MRIAYLLFVLVLWFAFDFFKLHLMLDLYYLFGLLDLSFGCFLFEVCSSVRLLGVWFPVLWVCLAVWCLGLPVLILGYYVCDFAF